MFGFFKKKKVAEPIKQDRAKFETMEESVHQSYDADIAAMDSVRNTQNEMIGVIAVSYTHLTLPTSSERCISRWSPYH